MAKSYLLISFLMELRQLTEYYEELERLSSSVTGSAETTITSTTDISDQDIMTAFTELQRMVDKLTLQDGAARRTALASSTSTSSRGGKTAEVYSLFPSQGPSPDSTE